MPDLNPQSQWTYDLLWTKSRSYMERALNAPRDDDAFPFWASLSLELLARATLAHVSPILLAETAEPDGRNLLHALGLTPKIKNFVPKSLQTSDVLTRCEQIVPNFTKDLELFCRGLTNKRNEELHSGGLPFAQLQNHTWLLRIPVKLDSDSTPSWTRIPEQAGQSERSDAGFSGFTLLMS